MEGKRWRRGGNGKGHDAVGERGKEGMRKEKGSELGKGCSGKQD